MKQNIFLITIGLLILSSCSKSDFDFIQVVPFIIIAEGSYSDLEKEDSWVIKNENAWSEFLAQSNLQEYISAPINFETHILLAVSLGESPSGGYSIHISEIEEFTNELIVHIISSTPDKNDEVTPALTQPYQVVRIEKTSKKISFVK